MTRILALLLLMFCGGATAQPIPALFMGPTATTPSIAFTSLTGAGTSTTTSGSGTYTVAAPSNLASASWGGGCSGSSTVSAFSASAGAWSATFTTPVAAGTSCTITATGTGSNTATATSPGVTITGTYAGLSDAVGAAPQVAWGLRAVSLAYATANSKLVNLRRASDGHLCDMLAATSGGLGVTASCGTGGDNGKSFAAFAGTDATCSGTIASTTMALTGCSSTPNAHDPVSGTGIVQPAYIVSCGTFTSGAGSCTLNVAQTVSVSETITMQVAVYTPTLYDMSGSAFDCTQATTTAQFQLLPSATPSGQPALLASGGQGCVATLSTYNQPVTLVATAIRTGNFTTKQNLLISEVGSNYTQMSYMATASEMGMYASTAEPVITVSDNVWHALQFLYSGASSTFQIDGSAPVTASPNPGTGGGIGGGTSVGAYTAGSTNYMTGQFSELIGWGAVFTSTQYNAAHASEVSWWGTP